MTDESEGTKGEALPFTRITRTRDGELTIFQVRGEATPPRLVDALREFLADPTRGVLWDLRDCRLSPLYHDQLRWLVSQLMRSDHSKRRTGRSAFVCRGDDDRNVMRLLIAYAEANEYRIELAVFGSVKQAQRWLGRDPESEG